jgi:acetate kinase
LAGDFDMRALLARDDDAARFAVEHFCYWAARHAGSAIIAMGGLDAVAFTGGIGENAAPIRKKIMAHLACFGEVPVHVVAADEERQIARDAIALMDAGY